MITPLLVPLTLLLGLVGLREIPGPL